MDALFIQLEHLIQDADRGTVGRDDGVLQPRAADIGIEVGAWRNAAVHAGLVEAPSAIFGRCQIIGRQGGAVRQGYQEHGGLEGFHDIPRQL